MNPNDHTDDNIQDQNLVNDQITAAIDKLSETASAAVAAPPEQQVAEPPAPAPAPQPQAQPAAPAPQPQAAHTVDQADTESLGSISLNSSDPAATQPHEEHHEQPPAEHTEEAVPPPAPTPVPVAVEEHHEESHEEPQPTHELTLPELPIAEEHHEEPAHEAHAEPAASTEEAPKSTGATINVKQAPSDMGKLKQQALAALAPIVSELDVSQEQKYHTVMEAAEANDDMSFLPNAFDMAKSIEDEKTRAKALQEILDRLK